MDYTYKVDVCRHKDRIIKIVNHISLDINMLLQGTHLYIQNFLLNNQLLAAPIDLYPFQLYSYTKIR